jgi:hypothetical protein
MAMKRYMFMSMHVICIVVVCYSVYARMRASIKTDMDINANASYVVVFGHLRLLIGLDKGQ